MKMEDNLKESVIKTSIGVCEEIMKPVGRNSGRVSSRAEKI